jgi:hypothetical protein
MARVDLALAEWNSGELLSAARLNEMSAAVNAIKGACAAPPATFVKSGVTGSKWYARRQYQYVHVRYSVTVSSGNVTVTIGGSAVVHSASVDDYWRTFDLDSDLGAPAVGAWWSITANRSGDGNFFVEEIIESTASTPTGTGSYTAPPTFSTGDNAATFLTKLQTLRTSILSFVYTVNPPSATFSRATDDRHYTLRRRQDALVLALTTGSEPNTDVIVSSSAGGQTVFTETDDRDFYTYTLTYASMTYPPPLNEAFTLQIERDAGNLIIDDIGESGYSQATYAPTWAHGDSTSNASAMVALMNQYGTVLSDAYSRLGVVGWQFPCIYKPDDTPRWGMRKHKRYLHYMRDGSQACYIRDPYSTYDDVSLSRTTNEPNTIGVFDMDSVDWLAYGRLFWVHQGEIMWQSDEP